MILERHRRRFPYRSCGSADRRLRFLYDTSMVAQPRQHPAGLVRILPQRETLIVKISPAAVEDAHFVRAAVECSIVREVVRATP